MEVPLLIDYVGECGPPILWLEELHDFTPTEKRLSYLHRLVDRVYTLKWTIVAATKLTPPALKAKLGLALPAHIRGIRAQADKAKWMLWNFNLAPKSAKPATKNSRLQRSQWCCKGPPPLK